MTQKYFAILTKYGEAEIAEATAQNKTIHIEKMAVGDGNGKDTVPSDTQTKLIKENYRNNLNSLKSEAGKNTVIAELIIKETIGGWWIREMGLYDDKGGLVAVANCPASYKPLLAEGSGKVQTLRMVFVVSNTAAVTISVSQDIGIASIELVEETMKKHIKDDDPHSKDYYNKHLIDQKLAPCYQNKGGIEGGVNLNSITTSGFWTQARNEDAETGANYPALYAGLLEVFAEGGFVYQKYTTYIMTAEYTRRRQDKTWSSWVLKVDENSGTAINSSKLEGHPASFFTQAGTEIPNSSSQGLPEGTDLNKFYKTGFYDGSGLLHAPDEVSGGGGSAWLYIRQQGHSRGNDTWLVQQVSPLGDHPEYPVTWWTRSLRNKAWTKWVKDVNEESGTAPDAAKLGGTLADKYALKTEYQAADKAHVDDANPHGERYYLKEETNGVVNEVMHQHQAAQDPHPQYTTPQEVMAMRGQTVGAGTADLVLAGLDVGTEQADWGKCLHVLSSRHFMQGYGYTVMTKLSTVRTSGAGTGYGDHAAIFSFTGEQGQNLGSWRFELGGFLKSESFKVHNPAGCIANAQYDFDGVSKLIRWASNGNYHTIFDASSGYSPTGRVIDRHNAEVPWRINNGYPSLMGDNGSQTFGLRVDSARFADVMADGSFGVPTGVPVPWPRNSPPDGWIFMQGQGIDPAEAPVLASLYGATLPDLRGMYISGWDAGRGIDPGREVLSYQAANVGEHQHTVPFDDGGWLQYSGGGGQPGVNYVRTQDRATVGGPQGRTRPDNVAFNYIVRWG